MFLLLASYSTPPPGSTPDVQMTSHPDGVLSDSNTHVTSPTHSVQQGELTNGARNLESYISNSPSSAKHKLNHTKSATEQQVPKHDKPNYLTDLRASTISAGDSLSTTSEPKELHVQHKPDSDWPEGYHIEPNTVHYANMNVDGRAYYMQPSTRNPEDMDNDNGYVPYDINNDEEQNDEADDGEDEEDMEEGDGDVDVSGLELLKTDRNLSTVNDSVVDEKSGDGEDSIKPKKKKGKGKGKRKNRKNKKIPLDNMLDDSKQNRTSKYPFCLF